MNTPRRRRYSTRRYRIQSADSQAVTDLARFGGSLITVGIVRPDPEQAKKMLDERAKKFLQSVAVALLERWL